MKLLFSNKTTLVLLFIFALAQAVGTFLENDHGTEAVKSVVYNAWWFELTMALLAVNFAGNISKYGLLKKKRFPVFLFHVAFIVIIIGAFVTRYIGYEGIISIREGEQTSELITLDRYLSVTSPTTEKEQKLNISSLKHPSIDWDLGNGVRLTCNQFVKHAGESLADTENGKDYLEIVVAGSAGRKDMYLEQGHFYEVDGHIISFDNPNIDADIKLTTSESGYLLTSKDSLPYMVMATQESGTIVANNQESLKFRSLYRHPHFSVVVKQGYKNKKKVFKSLEKKQGEGAPDMLLVTLHGKTKKELNLFSVTGNFGQTEAITFEGQDYIIQFGPKSIMLPYALKLRDFQLDRYPGSSSPSSFASEITVIDGETSFDYRIFMNNVLDYKGFRFFQASYDTDEKGTVLSVNQDYWGTNITYLGYFLMSLGMLWSLFSKSSRFQFVLRDLNRLKSVLPFLLFLSVVVSKGNSIVIPQQAADDFNELLVQDMDGRIKPLNSLSTELLRKIHRKSSYTLTKEGVSAKLNANQVFLSINMYPQLWEYEPIIKIDANSGWKILELLNLPNAQYISFRQLIDDYGQYKLSKFVEETNRKKPATHNTHDKEVLKVDERFNILYQALSGFYLKIFPLPDDPSNTWYTQTDAITVFKDESLNFTQKMLPLYYKAVYNKDTAKTNEYLSYLHTFQEKIGKEVIPPKARREAEKYYNSLQIFNKLFPAFWMLGIIMIVLAVLHVVKNHKVVHWSMVISKALVIICFLLLTANIILRWYVANYPPWSNSYEMIILVSWFLVLFGIIFSNKSPFALPLASIFTGTLLFVSFLDWLSPEITNLVPVLKSYWLKIHVAIIVGSYAPLALSALLGLMAQILMIFNGKKIFSKSIAELTAINELSMTIGLYMLAIGTFLGGVWANESWGRYWGWDPKETWAMISVIVYAIVVHLRLIPSLKSTYIFCTSSVFAFFSIIMTSYGVNYYLSGLHSYGKGDPVPIPQFIYWLVATLVTISIISYFRDRQLNKEEV